MRALKLLVFMCFALVVVMPNAASMLGVSTYAATKVVDAIMLGMSIWAIIGLVAVSGGAVAAVWWGVKELVKRVGRRAAIAW
ncbi:uberolysin/carnocyclin family circular bacteriocin [Aerococcaceae bacterium NML160702]|nr:uberolysin/carnocyclin family circular bacteriocin [Aerococcaceae bacterium NML171108]MCW6677532.1 uberolysin/carnocyclin family circular bacteriocin [Aerococcaceae bacterium NML180378]MCW6681134.1 uberolysin/carnocyclin family circular bacteriocin [Aerococcaceae bacterium NML130460]MCW6682993.1 uberolysin/carnocyclin family circular bacteriocin [Aerococcaceae bacterium NML160702]